MAISQIPTLAALAWQDWTVIVAFLAVSIGVGLLFTRRAGRSVEEYFVSGRSLPWWLAGTSMVATTLAADTPLAVTEFVRGYGIYHNWFWWSIGLGAVLSTVLLARLWRRSGVRTDIQLIELRYSGPAAHVLRGFRAGYFGIVWNLVTMAWVTAAMVSIGTEAVWGGGETAVVLAPREKVAVIAVLLALAGVYSIFAGLWGVVVTDLLQFVLAMVGAVALAYFSVRHVGGMDALLAALPGSGPLFDPDATLRLVPPIRTLRTGGLDSPFFVFAVYVLAFWWTDKTVDQGGYLAQRLLACKSENHSLGASLWFAIAHYALRPWPWIIAALATLVLFPAVTDHKATYTMLIVQVMGPWWRGLLIASLLAAFISTINTQINWGASYLLNDLYQPYVYRRGSGRHYVWVGRLLSAGLLLGAGAASYYVGSIEQAWKFLALLGAGSGVVLLARWLWWRANAAGELAALCAALGCSIYFAAASSTLQFAHKLLVVLPIVIGAWLLVTFLTPATRLDRLVEFVRRIRPPGPGWHPIHTQAGTQPPAGVLWRVAGAWLGGVTLVFGLLIAIGRVLLVGWSAGVGWLVLAAAGGALLALAVPRGEQETATEHQIL